MSDHREHSFYRDEPHERGRICTTCNFREKDLEQAEMPCIKGLRYLNAVTHNAGFKKGWDAARKHVMERLFQ